MIRVELTERGRNYDVPEILARIGIANMNTKTLYPTCYLTHIDDRVYIAHFKELLAIEKDSQCFETDLESKASISIDDITRRDNIVDLLLDWGLVELHPSCDGLTNEVQNFKVVKKNEISQWNVVHKYNVK